MLHSPEPEGQMYAVLSGEHNLLFKFKDLVAKQHPTNNDAKHMKLMTIEVGNTKHVINISYYLGNI